MALQLAFTAALHSQVRAKLNRVGRTARPVGSEVISHRGPNALRSCVLHSAVPGSGGVVGGPKFRAGAIVYADEFQMLRAEPKTLVLLASEKIWETEDGINGAERHRQMPTDQPFISA
ncbi:hypothetical protein NDU88_008664 [Pleurodeles waltl]|uniref:Uncharacterized protein n=1 Tax=Pleurodeles waltl TaxID=8319 RepID=A0AAV7QV62_PLEWA|nr:hypothetical protein NDU88_008664 [Pleurodeles waltl]